MKNPQHVSAVPTTTDPWSGETATPTPPSSSSDNLRVIGRGSRANHSSAPRGKCLTLHFEKLVFPGPKITLVMWLSVMYPRERKYTRRRLNTADLYSAARWTFSLTAKQYLRLVRKLLIP